MAPSEHRLPIVDATPENTAALGRFVGPSADPPPRHSPFYRETVDLWNVEGFVSDDDTTFTVARVHPRPNEVRWMERHFKHTQAFIPLGGDPFVVVMAPPSEGDTPEPGTVKALRFDGSAGFMMHVGTWHEFPFAAADKADVIVVLRHETNRDLEQKENDEAVGADLEKRNVQVRLGTVFTF